MNGITSAKSAKRSIVQQSESGKMWSKFPPVRNTWKSQFTFGRTVHPRPNTNSWIMCQKFTA